MANLTERRKPTNEIKTMKNTTRRLILNRIGLSLFALLTWNTCSTLTITQPKGGASFQMTFVNYAM